MRIGRKHRRGWLAAALALTIGAGRSPEAGAGSTLAERVEAALNGSEFAESHWGLLVVDVATGRPIFERDADRLFCPASVTKLFTTAAALAELGPEHRFKTPVVRRGEVKDGVLRGT